MVTTKGTRLKLSALQAELRRHNEELEQQQKDQREMLEKLRVRGGGPTYAKFGRRVVFDHVFGHFAGVAAGFKLLNRHEGQAVIAALHNKSACIGGRHIPPGDDGRRSVAAMGQRGHATRRRDPSPFRRSPPS